MVTELLLKINKKILYLLVFLSGLYFCWPVDQMQLLVVLTMYCIFGFSIIINLHNMNKQKELFIGIATIVYEEVGEEKYYDYWVIGNIINILALVGLSGSARVLTS